MTFTMKSIVAVAIAAFALSGCATGYDKYLTQIEKINASQADQNNLKLAALRSDNQTIAELANGSSDAVKVAAANAIAIQNIVAVLAVGGGKGGGGAIVPQAPQDPLQSFTNLLGMIVPSAVQVYGITKNAAVAMRQSDNSTAVALSTNQAFEHISTGGFSAIAGVNPQGNITINSGGDAINGNNNSTTRRNCNGGGSNSSGNGGNAANGGTGGVGGGTTTGAAGGTGGASGPAGSANPASAGGSANC